MTRRSEIPWQTLSSRPVYASKWISVREDIVALPDGRTIYGVVSCGECVGLLPFLDADTILLVGQYGTLPGGRRGRCRPGACTRGRRPSRRRSGSSRRRRATGETAGVDDLAAERARPGARPE